MRFRKTKLLTKLLILALLVYGTVTLVSLQKQIDATNAEISDYEQQKVSALSENLQLQSDISALGTDESVKKLAEERLGMIAEGVVLFIPQNN